MMPVMMKVPVNPVKKSRYFWMYSPEAVYRRGLASAFWLSLENDTREIAVAQGETKIAPVELHHWKELDTALYLRLDDGGNACEFPDGLSVSFDLDSSVVSLTKDGWIGVFSKDQYARENPPQIKQVSSDGEIVVRDIGRLSVSAEEHVPAGTYYCGLSAGDTDIKSNAGGNTQLLTIKVLGKSEIADNDNNITKVKVYLFPRDTSKNQDAGVIANAIRNNLGIKLTADYAVNTGASKLGIYDLSGNVIVPNGVDFYIYPDLRKSDGSALTLDDMNSHQSLGNGVTVGDIALESTELNANAELIPAIWIVVAEPDIEKADAHIVDIIRIIMG